MGRVQTPVRGPFKRLRRKRREQQVGAALQKIVFVVNAVRRASGLADIDKLPAATPPSGGGIVTACPLLVHALNAAEVRNRQNIAETFRSRWEALFDNERSARAMADALGLEQGVVVEVDDGQWRVPLRPLRKEIDLITSSHRGFLLAPDYYETDLHREIADRGPRLGVG